MRLNRMLTVSALVAVMFGPGMSAPAGARAAVVNQQDRVFLVASHQGDMAEILSGADAAAAGMCPQVRQLGSMLVADHTRLYQQGAAVADDQAVLLPPVPDPEQTGLVTETARRQGADFDRTWLRMQEDFHLQTLQAGAQEAAAGSSPRVTALARATAPVIDHHLTLVRQAMSRC
ncbi:DUF4142 domain-containing protein [Rhodococcus sp. D2-41]|uniref:DUF4142 domain-containing protein n=1 Tax=Speluncibacter jeojiensis TaxID=2710754 RepID=UPI00240FCF4F|nr:DUF4142 domain-containing protein [Rhodococcus sp. D2-41]MDG3010785.1 DUF4142 domain-containing protein [Rhodococcus sp. D2-41]